MSSPTLSDRLVAAIDKGLTLPGADSTWEADPLRSIRRQIVNHPEHDDSLDLQTLKSMARERLGRLGVALDQEIS